MSGPPITGYRPESMFKRIVEGVNDKLRAGQAVGAQGEAVPVLVVEMSQSELTRELADGGFYRREFERTLDAELTDFYGYGVVVFCEAVGWGKPLVPHLVRVDDRVADAATVRFLFRS
jgi:hypothetical protein